MHYGQGQSLDWGKLVVLPLKNMLINLIAFIPDFLAALFILLAGWLIALLSKFLVEKCLKSVGFDKVAGKIGISGLMDKDDKKSSPHQLIGLVTFWGAMFITFIIALDRLRLREISSQLDRLFSYIITIIIVAVIAVVGIILSKVVYKIIWSTSQNSGSSKPKASANIAKWIILIFTAIVCLSHIGIPMDMLLTLVAAILFTICATFILAFGFGGRAWAGKILDKITKE